MSRFFERRRSLHLVATLTMFLVAVSVAHVDDYGMLSPVAPLSDDVLTSLDATTQFRTTMSGSRSDTDHDCSCLLCTATVPNSLRSRLLPPHAGKLSTPVVAAIAGALHLSEVFHPPSA